MPSDPSPQAARDGSTIRRRFVFAPVMEKLGARVEAAEKAAEGARELLDEIEDADDWLERLVWVVAAARDVKRGLKSVDDLQDECDRVIDSLPDELPDAAKMAIKRVA